MDNEWRTSARKSWVPVEREKKSPSCGEKIK